MRRKNEDNHELCAGNPKPKTRLSPPAGNLKPACPRQRETRNSKHLVTGLLLALAGICVSLFLLELGARLLPPPYDPTVGEIFACHNRLGWTGVPHFQGMLEDPNYRQQVSFNSLGMHDTEHSLEKPANTFRILLLGDSFIHAVQVSETETAHQRLEDYLNEGGSQPQFEVISGGVVNWGTNQQLIFYREVGRNFQPDLVLLAFYIGNDFMDNLPGNVITSQGFNCYAPYFARCNGQFNPDPLTYAPGLSNLDNNCSRTRHTLINSAGWLYQHSRLFQQIEPLIVANRPRQVFGQTFPLPFTALYFPTTETELAQAWQITLATLAQLRQEVEADGARFAAVLISPEIIVRLGVLSPAEQEVLVSESPILAKAQADRPNRRLAEFLNRQNISFIDLAPLMIEHLVANPSPLYITGEGHWTAEGNRVAGVTLGQWLRQNSFLFSQK